MSESSPEKIAYKFSHLIDHLTNWGDYDKLWTQLDRGFLADQAEHAHGFQNGSRDLETHVLPAAIEQADWPRFLRWALVAMNLRETATELAQEPILDNLIRHGRRELAANLVAQITDSQVRARARAVMLAAVTRTGGTVDSHKELRLLREELDDAPPPADDDAAEAWLETLRVLTRHLEPGWLHEHWARWVARLENGPPTPSRDERVQRAWQALAESWIERDLSADSGLWEALGKIPRECLPAFLPRRVAASPAEDGTLLVEPLPPPLGGEAELLWQVRIAILGRRTRSDPTAATSAWKRLDALPVSWSPELAEAGRELWPRFTAERLTVLAARIDDPVARAALLVTFLEEQSGDGLDKLVRHTLAEITDASRQLRWTLRFLATPRCTSPSRRYQIEALSRYFGRLRHDVPAVDLARFLDLVAAELPAELGHQLEKIVSSPDSSPETLRTLAISSRSRAVLDLLFEHAENHAAAVSPTPSEGFLLRRQLLVRITLRLVNEWGGLSSLDRVAPRLLPDEEDQLRATLVDTLLTAYRPDEVTKLSIPALARQVCMGIRSPRLERLTRLRIASDPTTLEESTAPAALYEAVATTDIAEDELHSLAPLLEKPNDPADLARRHLNRVRDPDRRVQALVDLARHALDFQSEALKAAPRDPAAALAPLAGALEALTSDELLVALTPELVALGAESGPHRAVMELREAIRQVLHLETVDEELRIEVLETLISGVARVFFGDQTDPPPRRAAAAAQVFHWLVRLPAEEKWPGQESWSRLLPIVLAATDALPLLAQGYVRYPMRVRFCVDSFLTLTKLLGLERMLGFCRWWEGLLPRKWLERLRTPWGRGAEGFTGWLEPTQKQALEAYFSDDSEQLRSYAGTVAEQAEPNARELETLAWLLCRRLPDGVPPLVERLPSGPARDAFCLRLLRCRWLPAEPARQIAAQIADPFQARHAEVRLENVSDPAWVEALAWLVHRHGFDVRDPRHTPLRRALRKAGHESGCRALAQATRDALTDGGRPAGERALRWWLHAYLGPERPRAQCFEHAAAAIREARALTSRLPR